MNWKIVQWHSLKTRVTLITLAIFLIGLWGLSLYASRMLREDMERLLGEQQYATATLVATEVNGHLDDRLRALEAVAARVNPTILGTPKTVQAFLEDNPILQRLFNGGVAALRPDGTVIADAPLLSGRTGVNDVDLDRASAAALTEGKPAIGRPAMGMKQQAPIFDMVVPIRDAHGRVIGALAGVINLGKPNFLDQILQNRYGKTGGYLLIAPSHRLIVTATDKSRIMEPLHPGINPLSDRFMQGYEGSGVAVNSRGVQTLASARGVPVAGWIAVATLPTEEAFAPVRIMEHRLLLATTLFTLLAAGLIWWMLRRQLTPVLATAKILATLSDMRPPMDPLPITQRDEIGSLIGGFNHLLEALSHREEVLRETKRFLKESQSIAGLGSYVLAIPTGLWKSSDVFDRVFGIDPAYERDLEGWVRLIHPLDRMMLADYLGNAVFGQGQSFDKEYRIIRHHDGAERWVHGLGKVEIDAQGRQLKLHSTIQDITERRQAETELRIAATAFESHEGMIVTNADRVIQRVNKAFTTITGYTAQEAVGKNPHLLSSGRHDAAFYAALWECLALHGKWQGEIWNRRKSGEVYPQGVTISAVKDDTGLVTHYVAAFTDITERKQMENDVYQLAFYDALTRLPNRRLLNDRLSQTIASGKRSGSYGALMVLDLDNFKPLNDTYGHAAGDLLLIEAAARLKNCVREVDTVARFGGDEFVAVLSDLHTDQAESALQAGSIAEKIRVALSQPYLLTLKHEGQETVTVEHHCTASIGVALFLNHETNQDDILKWADAAMYQAKADGRNLVRFYKPTKQ